MGFTCECISSYVLCTCTYIHMYVSLYVRTCSDMLCYGTVCVRVSAELQWP